MRRLKFIKRYNIDILNEIRLKKRFEKVYIEVKEFRKKRFTLFELLNFSKKLVIYTRKKYKYKQKNFRFNQIIKKFYGNLLNKQIKFLKRKVISSEKVENKNIFTLLERRLDILIWRAGLLSNMLLIKKFIIQGKIFVNKCQIKNINYSLKKGDVISFAFHSWGHVFIDLKYRIFLNMFDIYSNDIECNFKTFEVCMFNDNNKFSYINNKYKSMRRPLPLLLL